MTAPRLLPHTSTGSGQFSRTDRKTGVRLAAGPGKQDGAALAMAMMVLLILTILGISAMSGSVLETRMAGNIQDSTAAFQAAENGINETIDDNSAFVLDSVTSQGPFNYSYTDSNGVVRASAQITTILQGYADPKPAEELEEIESALDTQYAVFEITSTGTTSSGARAVHHQGAEQQMPPTSD